MQPENYAEAPSVITLVTTGPNEPKFWVEVGKTFDWVKYVWVGPTPNVTIDLNNVYAGGRFSSQTIYSGIIEAVDRLKIPGVVVGPQIIHEGGPFSPYRAYLRIRREFSEFLICAAPVGNSFFITVRKIDRFRHVKWFHYLIVAFFILNLLSSLGMLFIRPALTVPFFLVVTLGWSFMRYGARVPTSWLAEHLPEVPLVGALYLRWFRPDTYFRQDLHSAFLALAGGAIEEVIKGMDPTQPIRPATEAHGGPILKDLHQKG